MQGPGELGAGHMMGRDTVTLQDVHVQAPLSLNK